MNTPEAHISEDVLNQFGLWILSVDTRWFLLTVLVGILLFVIVVRVKQQRWPSRDDAISLFLAAAQLYGAAAIAAILFLTEPAAIDKVGKFERQSAGLLAAIFLGAGLFVEMRRLWSRHTSGSGPPTPQGGALTTRASVIPGSQAGGGGNDVGGTGAKSRR